MQVSHISIDGRTLQRGFWLYIWEIRSVCGRRMLYVGRTGDNSSHYAASPFARVTQHLNLKPSAKGNSLASNLAKEDISPIACRFEMTAIGPIFSEQHDFEAHKPHRDTTGRLELELAQWLRNRKYVVLGTHSSKAPLDLELWGLIKAQLEEKFPVLSDC